MPVNNHSKYVTYPWLIGMILVLISLLFGFNSSMYYPNSQGCALEQKVSDIKEDLKEGQTEIKTLIRELRREMKER